MFNYISKKINKILNWFYSKDGYYSLKSGLYLDYYFKKLIERINKEINFYLGLIFLDNYLLTRLINKFFDNYTKLNQKIIIFKKQNNFHAMRVALLFLFLCLLLLIMFIIHINI